MFGDQWPKIADHVGPHSVLECITHFLQLPIEDDFLDELEHRAALQLSSVSDRAAQQLSGGGEGAGGGGQQQEEEEGIGRVPLGGVDGAHGNPVMSMVSGWEGRLL